MASVSEQIRAAVLAKLAAIATIPGLTVERNRGEAVSDYPALVLRDGGDRQAGWLTGADQWQASIEIAGFARPGVSDAEAEIDAAAVAAALAELKAAAVKALLADVTLGGVSVDLRFGDNLSDVGRDEGLALDGQFILLLEVDYWTRPNDPDTLGP